MKWLAVVLALLWSFLYAEEQHAIEVYGKKIPSLFYFPEHSLSAVFSQKHSFLAYTIAFKLERERGTNTNRYYLNVNANKTFGKVNVFLEARNLFDAIVEKIPGLPEPPRSFSAGIKYSF